MLDIQKHKFILVSILKDIYSDVSLGTIFGFKGGTAFYLFYNLPRFSVDLDFNLLDIKKKGIVFNKIKKILGDYGKLKKAQEKRFTLFFLLFYNLKAPNIKIEISKKEFPNHYEIKSYLGIPMLVMKKEDMFSHKLVALLERKTIANRDLFDLYFFMRNHWDFNKEIIELRTGMNYKDYLKKCILAVKKVDEKYILQGLGEILDEKQKVWAKKNLKEEVSFLLNFYLENY